MSLEEPLSPGDDQEMQVVADTPTVDEPPTDAVPDAPSAQSDDAEAQSHGASARATTINVICNVIGGGVLALPTAFNDSSMLIGILLLFLMTFITTMNLYFIVECAQHAQVFNYRVLLHKGIGPRWGKAVDVALLFFPFGALIAYARVVADSMPPVLENFFHASGFVTTDTCWFLIGGVIFFVFSCRRALAELKFTSIFGILTIMYALLLVIIRFFDGSYVKGGDAAAVHEDFEAVYLTWNIFKTIPIISFSLSVHNNAPAYYEELANRSPKKMYRVLGVAHLVIVTTYILMAVFGLLTFGPDIKEAKGDILEAYSRHDVLMNTARLGMFIHFACVFPILQMAARRGLNNLVFPGKELKLQYLCLESFIIVVLACTLAALIPNIATVLAINGALFGSVIVMMAPSFLFLCLKPPSQTKWEEYRHIAATLSIVAGAVVAVVGVCVVVDGLVEGE